MTSPRRARTWRPALYHVSLHPFSNSAKENGELLMSCHVPVLQQDCSVARETRSSVAIVDLIIRAVRRATLSKETHSAPRAIAGAALHLTPPQTQQAVDQLKKSRRSFSCVQDSEASWFSISAQTGSAPPVHLVLPRAGGSWLKARRPRQAPDRLTVQGADDSGLASGSTNSTSIEVGRCARTEIDRPPGSGARPK
jgi:hypothetical protein